MAGQHQPKGGSHNLIRTMLKAVHVYTLGEGFNSLQPRYIYTINHANVQSNDNVVSITEFDMHFEVLSKINCSDGCLN
jgi:hypothetical protein